MRSDSLEIADAPGGLTNWLPNMAVAIGLALLLLTQLHDPFYPSVSLVLVTMLLAALASARQYVTQRAQRHTRHELEALAGLERLALESSQLQPLMQEAAVRIARHLNVLYCAVLAYERANGELRTIAGVGWPASVIGHLTVPATPATQGGYTLAVGKSVVVGDVSAETRFRGAPILFEQGIVSGASTPVRGRREPFGILAVHTTGRRDFSREEVSFLEMAAGVLGAAADRSLAEDQIRHHALHDGLTGLPNRVLFEDRLTHALTSVRRRSRELAVLFIDMDNFQNINDSLGHAAGDEVLGAAAQRLAQCLRPEDTLARMGGDEFAVVLPEIREPDDAARTAERLLEALRAPFTTAARQKLVIAASIGIAVWSREQDTAPEELLRNADLAMYSAKQKGKGCSAFFAPSMHEDVALRLALLVDLRRALDNEEFTVHYQPIVTLENGTIMGAEALVRWNHPQRGLIAPGAFIEVAEETGLIDVIGRYVLHQACCQLQKWRESFAGHPDLSMTVNVSPQQFRSADLLKDVGEVLTRTGIPPRNLILEITESLLVDRGALIPRRMAELKRLGVRLAVDDFGTGYSALSYLQHFPIDILKIDKSFIDGLGNSADNDQLVSSIINLAHNLNLQTIAEGIETEAQARTLNAMSSELGQGFHFAKPLTAAELEQLIATAAHSPTSVIPTAATHS